MISIIGGGKMGTALARGLTSHGHKVTLVESDEARRESLAADELSAAAGSVPCRAAIIAVLPKDADIAISDAVAAGAERVISIVAGIPLSRLHAAAGSGVPVIRAMPNIATLVQKSAIAICAGQLAHETDLALAEEILSSVGTVVRVSEDQMDAVTGLSGSGPAYLFLVAEAMVDAGVAAGLPRAVAQQLTVTTFEGAADMLSRSGESPAELRSKVTTPAGTTAAGVNVLEAAALRASIAKAVEMAAARSHDLGHPARH